MAELQLEIITPEKKIYSGSIKSISVPGTKGSFQVLPQHAPIISTLEIGVVKIEEVSGPIIFYACGSGTIEVLNNKILLLADSFEAAADIDVERAKRALERAKDRLAIRNEEKINVARAEAALARAMNRIAAAEKFAEIRV